MASARPASIVPWWPYGRYGDDLALGFLGRLEHLELIRREVLLDRLLHDLRATLGLDRVQLDADIAKPFGECRCFGRARR